MGYRAVAITEDTGLYIPEWFVDKWEGCINIGQYAETCATQYAGEPTAPISYKFERKFHDSFIEDLQKLMQEKANQNKYKNRLQMIMMHEDGKVNRINIYPDKVVFEEPEGWEEVAHVHQY